MKRLQENKIRRQIRNNIRMLLENGLFELDTQFFTSDKQQNMARKIFGDNYLTVMLKLKNNIQLSPEEEAEAKENFLGDYMKVKSRLSSDSSRTNKLTQGDLSAVFTSENPDVLNDFVNYLINTHSTVDTIGDLERFSLLNLHKIPGASEDIAKKYLKKIFTSDVLVPEKGHNRWYQGDDSLEYLKAYHIAAQDDSFRDTIFNILKTKLHPPMKFLRKLEELKNANRPSPYPEFK